MHPLLNCRLVSLTRISGLGYRRCRRHQSSVARSSRLYSIVPRFAEMPAPQRRGGQDHAFYPTITQLLRGKNRDVVCCCVFTVKIKELVDITLWPDPVLTPVESICIGLSTMLLKFPAMFVTMHYVYAQTWRHQQNRNYYITYRNATERDRVTAISNMSDEG